MRGHPGGVVTRLVNSAGDFPVEAVHGFALANARYVQQVHGGVVRSTESPSGQVAVVLGGGSGHYPAFAGWVGPGMAHGAVCGNILASPSASQVESVVRAADNKGGALLDFGKYAGDVLHFGQAAERLRAEGVDVRNVTVSDDIASDTPANSAQRRWIAGDLLVFKIAGAAAEAGLGLDEVERVSRRTNTRTRSLGVTFGGCTLPGADHALFEVADGVMAIGLGIHGEPGISDAPLGLTVVEPGVGDHVTSLDMEGLSLTITFLDDELEQYWIAPIDTPAFRRGAVTDRPARSGVIHATEVAAVVPGSAESQALAGRLTAAIRAMAACAVENKTRLGGLDAIAGDGDHGQGMVLGTSDAASAAEAARAAFAGARTLLVRAGAAWSESAGGTSGALWGAALTAMGNALSDSGDADPDALVAAVRQGAEAIFRLGGATSGDKTMVDSLVPFVDALATARASGASLSDAWADAAAAAATAAEATSQIVARRGRARTHGEHSLGHPDPGATSFALLMAAVAAELAPSTPVTGELT